MKVSIPRIKKAIWCYKCCRQKKVKLKLSLMFASWYLSSEMVLD